MKSDVNALKFVIVGHVDHGKSTLIGRLFFDTDSLSADKMEEVKAASKDLGRQTEFAFLLDHLREEREQGITIDTAQTFFKTKKREYVIIDAPGHREFVKNMITGASQAEAAVLIIDVDQGVQEQTRRHAYILAMLGLEQVIVILNKMDLVGFSKDKFEQVRTEAEKFLQSINIKAKFYIPVSAIKGDNVAKRSKNMKWYDGLTVLESLDALQNRVSAENKAPVMPVQDIYKIGEKRIIAGRIEAGVIKKGQKVKILPSGEDTEVKSIEKFLQKTDKSVAGESTGITTSTPAFLERGNIICAGDGQPTLTDSFRANIFWMARENFDKEQKITLRCATQEISCKIEKIVKRMDSSTLEVIEEDAATLKPLEVGEVLIKTKRAVAIKRFNDLEELGRFVLVKNENTCAGGIITEV
ncbi:MAG: GTP-binding protein [Candidatus Omnitrophica bacterium]|nr:GTP-binding protein [Candidatus Omnitrophota bacterium]